MENKLKGPVLVEYVKDVLQDVADPYLDNIPDELYDEAVRRVGSVIWNAAIAEAKTATTGVYSSGSIDETYRRQIESIEDPFASEDLDS